MGQESRSQGLATFTTSPTSGVIPAKGTLDVEITLQASRLGRIQLPLQIKVCVLIDLDIIICCSLVVSNCNASQRRIMHVACATRADLPACTRKSQRAPNRALHELKHSNFLQGLVCIAIAAAGVGQQERSP